jgi:hypothetical protein
MSSYKSDVSEKVRFALTAALIPACNSDHRSGLVMLSRRFGKDHGEIHDRHSQLGTHCDAKGLPICRTSLQKPLSHSDAKRPRGTGESFIYWPTLRSWQVTRSAEERQEKGKWLPGL